MAIVIKPITVEVSKPNVFQAIAAKQNDSNSRFLKVTFVNEGEKIYIPSSAKVTINAERNDGQSNSYFGTVNNDGTAIVPIHSWILELPGYVDCDVSIIEEDSKLTCTTFSLLVEEASHGSDDISNDEQYDVLTDLISQTSGAASAIVNTASGSAIALNDISPIKHTLNVKATSKNLIPFPFTNSTSTIKGVTFTDNGDGTITANGMPTENAIYYFINQSFVLPKGKYTFSGLPSGSAYETHYIGIAASVDGVNFEKGVYEGGLTIEIDTVRALYLVIKKGNAVNNLVFKPQLEVGSTATPYAPYVADLSAVDLIAGGKNFAEINSIKTPTSEKPIIFSGKITGNFVLSCDVNCECTNMGATMFQVTSEDGTIEITPYAIMGNPNGYPLSGTITKIQFINYSACQDGSVDNIQLELGTSKTAFEPHTAPTTHPINADGTVDGVKSIYPTTTLIPDTEGVVIDATYNVDTKKYIDNKFVEIATAIINK